MTDVKIEKHAIDRAVQRFGVQRENATKWIQTQFSLAQFIGEHDDSSGKRRRLYSNGFVLFGVSTRDMAIVTVYKPTTKSADIKRKVTDFVAKEVRKIQRKLEMVERESTIKIAEMRLEIAQVDLRKAKSRSDSVRLACDSRVSALNEEIRLITIEIEKTRAERDLAMKTHAAYV